MENQRPSARAGIEFSKSKYYSMCCSSTKSLKLCIYHARHTVVPPTSALLAVARNPSTSTLRLPDTAALQAMGGSIPRYGRVIEHTDLHIQESDGQVLQTLNAGYRANKNRTNKNYVVNNESMYRSLLRLFNFSAVNQESLRVWSQRYFEQLKVNYVTTNDREWHQGLQQKQAGIEWLVIWQVSDPLFNTLPHYAVILCYTRCYTRCHLWRDSMSVWVNEKVMVGSRINEETRMGKWLGNHWEITGKWLGNDWETSESLLLYILISSVLPVFHYLSSA